jgi:hypothetical protein
MIRTIFSACGLLTALSLQTTVVHAEEGVMKPAFGFDLSFAYALPNDRRFTGSAVGFELSLLEIANHVRVSYYHEQGFWHGDDGEDHVTARSVFNAIHFDYHVFAEAGQQVSLFANAGHIQFHQGYTKSAFAADLGVHYDPWVATARGVTTNFGITLGYRYCHIGHTDVFEDGSPVSDAGGFLAGVHGLVRF